MRTAERKAVSALRRSQKSENGEQQSDTVRGRHGDAVKRLQRSEVRSLRSDDKLTVSCELRGEMTASTISTNYLIL